MMVAACVDVVGPIARKFLVGIVLWAVCAGDGRASTITVNDAQVPATVAAGADVALTMTVINAAPTDDALLRVRCPFANFSERHAVDYGEGAPSMRVVSAIPLPANATSALTTKSYHVMLLQLREPLSQDRVLTCTIVFRNAGSQDVAVHVAPAANP